MYIKDNIAYAAVGTPVLKVSGVRVLDGHRLRVSFNNNDTKIFDFTPLLSMPVFAPLSDPEVFGSAYVSYGTVVWLDGEIDIAPETLYENGI